MTLQTSGPISLQQVNVELKQIATATISLNATAVRKLLGNIRYNLNVPPTTLCAVVHLYTENQE